MQRRESKLEHSIWSPIQKSGNPVKEEEKSIYKSEGTEDTRKIWPNESTKQGLHGFAETEATSMKPI